MSINECVMSYQQVKKSSDTYESSAITMSRFGIIVSW
jgi:hypothetical protein